jgi:hypothetical protein
VPWETLTSDDGIYLVNWDGVARIIRPYARGRAMVAYSDVVLAEKHWVGPDLYSLEVDWDKVRTETQNQTDHELMKFHSGARRSMQTQMKRLVDMLESAEDDHDEIQRRMLEAQSRTMENVEQSVRRGEIGLEVSKFVRDASAEFLMVASGYVTGGANSVALGGAFGVGAGSMLKGVGTYQETGKIHDAVATFSTNLLFGALDLKVGKVIEKATASLSGQIGLAIVWAKAKAVAEVPKSVIEGKHLDKAVSSGGVKLIASTPGTASIEGLKAYLEPLEMKPWAIPVEVALNLALDKAGAKLAHAGEKEPERKTPPRHMPPSTRHQHLMDAVLYDQSQIEKMAVRQIGSLGS